MSAATIVPLPGPSTAACAGGDAVWCAAGSRLLAFDERGACRLEVAAPAPITGLALAGSSLVAVLEGIRLAWMDPASGRVTAERGFSGPISLAVGPVAWLLDGDRGLALPLSGDGGLGAPHAIGAAARAVGDARRLWWVGNDDHRLHTVGGTIELDAALDGTGGLALCANSVWLSTARGLCRVNAWNGERGLTVDAP